jgi:hypothetical protein
MLLLNIRGNKMTTINNDYIKERATATANLYNISYCGGINSQKSIKSFKGNSRGFQFETIN